MSQQATRAEHVAWAKARALEYLERDEIRQAITSFVSDMNKHDECRMSAGWNTLCMMLMIQNDAEAVRQFIEGVE